MNKCYPLPLLLFALCVLGMNNSSVLAAISPFSSPYDTVKATEEERMHAFEMLKYIEENKRFSHLMKYGESVTLPIGIQKTMGEVDCTIIIHELAASMDGSYCNTYMIFTTPTGEKLAFKADNIRFSADRGFLGVAQPQLLGNDKRLLNDGDVQLKLANYGIASMEWDCFTVLLYPDRVQ